MADVPVTDENDDNWLYGDSNPEPPENGTADVPNGDAPAAEPIENSEDPPAAEEPENALDDSQFNDEHFEEGEQPDDEGNGDTQENGDTDSDDSEDDVKVIIGDVKSTPPAYPSLNIKRGGLLQVGLERQKQAGKFSVEEFETVGTINGVPAQEFNIDVLEDKPWRKPGADLTDYFNYGFNEDTWRGYCERQKRMRIHESCTGLVVLNSSAGRKMTGPIDVIGSRRDGIDGSPTDPPHIKQNMQIPVRENAIQVMTADRREYSRGKAFPDLSLPPPGTIPPPTQPDFFHQTQHQPPFYPNYQHEENNWGGNDSGWAPSEIKELTPGPMNIGPPPMCPHPGMPPHPGMGPPIGMPGCPIPHPGQMMGRPPMGPAGPYGQMNMHPRDVELREKEAMRLRECEKEAELREMREKDDRDPSEMRDRDRDRDRSRSIKPDRHREKSHRRERSRSRSRRHNKSRSRSPASRHRSKKKSSHRKDKDDSE